MTPAPERSPEGAEAMLLERRLRMQLDVAWTLTGKVSLEEVAAPILKAIAEAEGYQAAALWQVDPATDELRCVEFWSDPARPAPELERISRRTWFPRGELLPGQAWEHGDPAQVVDVARAEGFHRAFWAQKDGVRIVSAFPIPVGTEVVGVLELFRRSACEADPIFGEVMRAITRQIGAFLQRIRAEALLVQAEERLRRVLDHAPIVLFALDREGRFTLSQGSGLPALGLSPQQVVGQSVFDLYRDVPGLLVDIRRALAGEEFATTATLESLGLSYETRYTPVRGAGGAVVAVIGVAIDVTERARAEEALRRSEARMVESDRLAALGTLAAGVAHEINNPLSYVLLNVDLALRELGQLSGAAPERRIALAETLGVRLRDARGGLERVQSIVRDLKAFSRVGGDVPEPIDVNAVLDEALDLCASELRNRARVVREYGAPPRALGDRARLGQVFLNLLLNAAQATPEGDAAAHRIVVTTGTDAEGRVVVGVGDDGEGIPPDLLDRVFEPFFTTKPAGVGTGLGLSICHGIVTALGGEIRVESRVGVGSTFRITLPRASDVALAPPRPEAAAAPAEDASADKGRVLVVDDELVLGNALGRALEPDFEVTVVSSGREARQILLDGAGFDAILCDLLMPGVTGMDLYDDVLRIRPEVAARIIFMTGGSFTPKAREFLASVPNPALDKPFDLDALWALLRARTARG